MKHTFCFLFALLLLVPLALCACKSVAEESSSSEITDDASGGEALVPSLGEADYSGKVLRILSSGEETTFGKEPFGADEINSEPVNDTCISRNAKLEQEYGFTIETEFIDAYDTFITRVRNDSLSGTVTYDVVSTGLMTLASLSAEGLFLDLLTIENSHMDLQAEWWDVASNEDMTVMGKLFFTTGDILLLDDEYTRCIFYNKDILNDNQLENPVQLVYNQKWTLDVMYQMAKAVAVDGDDGIMDINGNDTWGLVGVAFDSYNLILGCDCPQVEKDEQDLPVLSMLNARNVNAFMKVFEIMSDNSCVAWNEQYHAWNDPNTEMVRDHFYNGKALFLMNTINVVNGEKMRTASIRYGILPMPKYDETQETYATTVDPYQFYCISIMNSCKDTDFVTFALEALAYTSRQMVTPEYYDRTLKNKRFLDDDDSPEMLDIIFSNRLVDISVAFNWDDCIQYYNNIAFSKSPDLVSYVESHQSAFEAAMNVTLEYFRSMDADV